MLMYRFPGQKIVSLNGHFKKYNSEIEGFIVTDYTGKNKWIFQENHSKKTPFTCKIKSKDKKVIEYSKIEYLKLGRKTIESIKQHKLKKLVISRIEKQNFDTSNTEKLFQLLCKKYQYAFVYYFQDAFLGTWIGASPELILKQKSSKYETTSIAATKLSDDLSEWSEKEILEQEYVSKYIQRTLRRLNASNLHSIDSKSFQAGPVRHLKTDFQFELKNGSVCKILDKLHPTPAVLGFPKHKSISAIKKIEYHNRELYTGYLGLLNKVNSTLYVNLRCAKIKDSSIFLFLGGGFTVDSDPQLEWLETENKKKTFSEILKLI